MLSGLQHERIICLLGACLAPPHICIVEELANAGSLFNHLHCAKPGPSPARGMPYVQVGRTVPPGWGSERACGTWQAICPGCRPSSHPGFAVEAPVRPLSAPARCLFLQPQIVLPCMPGEARLVNSPRSLYLEDGWQCFLCLHGIIRHGDRVQLLQVALDVADALRYLHHRSYPQILHR